MWNATESRPAKKETHDVVFYDLVAKRVLALVVQGAIVLVTGALSRGPQGKVQVKGHTITVFPSQS